MPAGIIDAITTYVAANYNGGTGITVWDGEVHRYDLLGNTVSPDSSGGIGDWPTVRFYMTEQGFTRSWTFEDPYYDQGELKCVICHTTRAVAEATMDNIEALLSSITNWTAIGTLLPANAYPTQNKPYVIQLLLKRWASYQTTDRDAKSRLIYCCTMDYDCWLHGAVPTS